MTELHVMKCHKVTIEEARASRYKDWVVNEKVDGTRTLFKNGQLVSPERVGFKAERFAHIQAELLKIDADLDGEVWLPEKGSNVHSVNKRENWAKCKYAVFDITRKGTKDLTVLPYRKRIEILQELIDQAQFKHTAIVRCFNSIDEGWKIIKDEGLEGLVIKNQESSYACIRSTNWLKIKNWLEAEVEIVGLETGKLHGSFKIKTGGSVNALSEDLVAEYQRLKMRGQVFGEIEYLFKTKDGKHFQPILKRLKGVD